MAKGDVSRGAQVGNSPILWAEAGPEAYIPLTNDSRRPRAIDLTRAVAGQFGYTLVPTLADGRVDSGWSRAQSTSSSTVVVAGGSGGLTNADRALMRDYINTSRQVLTAMPAAVQAGIQGKQVKDSDTLWIRNRAGV